MVNFARCKVLGANVLRGPKQIPWDGKLKYDYQLWIDSDIVFNTESFYRLIAMDKDIAAGWYMTEDGNTTSVAHWLEEDDFKNNGGVMNHETGETMSKRRKPFTVDYTGFGWVLIKNGVFENLEYPWFAPKMQVFDSGEVQDIAVRTYLSVLMRKRRASRSGVIRRSVWVMRRLVFFDKKIGAFRRAQNRENILRYSKLWQLNQKLVW